VAKNPFHIADIDPRVRPLILALNSRGYKTIYSCAGHKSDEGGYVTIRGKRQRGKLEAFLRDFGLDEFDIQYSPVTTTIIRFPGLGGSKGERIIPKLNLVIPKEFTVIILRLFRRNLHRLGIPIASNQSALISYALSKALVGQEVEKGKEL